MVPLISRIRYRPKKLILSIQRLGSLTDAELITKLSQIQEVGNLDLSMNDLHQKSCITWTNFLSAIAHNNPLLTKLSLSWNGLGYKRGEELAIIMAAIPMTVTTLCLSHNFLYRLSIEEWRQFFNACPPTVDSLDLSGNFLNKKTVGELIEILAAIPPTIKTVRLEGNFLGLLPLVDLKRILAAIPGHVHTLDLRENQLSSIAAAEWSSLLPWSITTLYLDNHFKNQAEIRKGFNDPPNWLFRAHQCLLSMKETELATQLIASIFAFLPLKNRQVKFEDPSIDIAKREYNGITPANPSYMDQVLQSEIFFCNLRKRSSCISHTIRAEEKENNEMQNRAATSNLSCKLIP